MKTTIKLSPLTAFVVQPSADGFAINFHFERGGKTEFGINLTPDECGVIMFAFEQALEARSIAITRACTAESALERMKAARGQAMADEFEDVPL